MGQRGPVPKRSAERAGHRAKADKPDATRMAGTVTIPLASEDWHVYAAEWYDSLSASGQSKFYEPSDWEYARIVAEMASHALTASHPSAQLIKAVLAAMDSLGTTEGARRRMRIEVERSDSPDSDVEDELAAIRKQYHDAEG